MENTVGGSSALTFAWVLVVAGCTALEPGGPSATIGPGGGTLAAGGATVEVPPGALEEPQMLLLSVGPGPVIELTPDVEFREPARITLDSSLWPDEGFSYVTVEENGEQYRIDDLSRDWRGAFYFALGFSQHRPARYVCRSSAGGAGWALRELFPCQAEREASGSIPPDLQNLRSCLSDVSYLGLTADPITPRPGRTADEAYLVTSEAAAALTELERLVQQQLGPSYHVHLNGAFDSSGRVHRSRTSLHGSGAAVDLAVCVAPCSPATKSVSLLGQLAPLAVQAGFTWVHFEDARHIHASIRSPSLQQCNPDPSTVVAIEGHVYAEGNPPRPLAGAVVGTSLDSRTALTDSAGHFLLQTVTPARYCCTPYTITIQAAGCQTFSVEHVWGDQPTGQVFNLICG